MVRFMLVRSVKAVALSCAVLGGLPLQAQVRTIKAVNLQAQYDDGEGTLTADNFYYTHPQLTQVVAQEPLDGHIRFEDPNLHLQTQSDDYNLGDLFKALGNCQHAQLSDANFDVNEKAITGSFLKLERACASSRMELAGVDFRCKAAPSQPAAPSSLAALFAARAASPQSDDDADSTQENLSADDDTTSAQGDEQAAEDGETLKSFRGRLQANQRWLRRQPQPVASLSLLEPCFDGELAFTAEKIETKPLKSTWRSRLLPSALTELAISVKQNAFDLSFHLGLDGKVEGKAYYLADKHAALIQITSARLGSFRIGWLIEFVMHAFADHSVLAFKDTESGDRCFEISLNRI